MDSQINPDMYTEPFQMTKTMHRDPYSAILPDSHSQKGKIVIITGAYGGIGAVRFTCRLLHGTNTDSTRRPQQLYGLVPVPLV